MANLKKEEEKKMTPVFSYKTKNPTPQTNSYRRFLEMQQQQLKAIAKEQPELYSQFAEDLAALDSSYRVLKTQAIQTPNREVIIKAMLQNLQLQAELLSKQLGIIHEFKNNKTLKNEKDTHPRI